MIPTRWNRVWLLFFVVLGLRIAPLRAQADNKDKKKDDVPVYVFYYPYGSEMFGGISSDALIKKVKEVTQLLINRLGIGGTVVDDDLPIPEVKRRFDAGKLDFTYLVSWDVIRYHENKIPVTPLVTYTIDGKLTSRMCVYALEGGPITSVKDLKGKRFNSPNNPLDWVMLRKALFDKGLDAPLDVIFPNMTYIQGDLTVIQYLMNGKLDAISGSTDMMTFMLNDPKLKKVKPLVCGPERTNNPVAFRNGVDQKFLDKVVLLAKNAHKDPAFKEVKFIFMAIRGTFVPVSWKDYKNILDLWEEAKKKGWDKEADKYFIKHPAPKTQRFNEMPKVYQPDQ